MAVAVVYGAGNIGRGFIGMLFVQSGYNVVFIDVDKALVATINRAGRYPVRTLPYSGGEDLWVEGVSAIDGNDVLASARTIAAADIMATSVGVRALRLAAPVIAAGLKQRFAKSNTPPLNILLCENLPGAHEKLAEWISEAVADEAIMSTISQRTGFVETSVGRMTPIQTDQMKDDDPLRISAEAYALLPVDRAGFIGRVPDVRGMLPFDGFEYYVKRKLYVHNMGHALCAYLGILAGDEYISDVVNRGDVRYAAQSAMIESARALSAEYEQPLPDLLAHVDDLIMRFCNKALGDTCARVGSDPARKLGGADRFIGASRLCKKHGVPSAFIETGAAAALLTHMRREEDDISARSAAAALAALSELDANAADDAQIGARIIESYNMLLVGADANGVSLAALADVTTAPILS